MAIVECPTQNNLPSFKYVISLDKVNYTLTFTFNSRMGKWFLDLADQVGSPIVSQVPIIASWPLFDRFNDFSIPPGTLFCYDSSNSDKDPGQFDLGDRCRIYYSEAGTI